MYLPENRKAYRTPAQMMFECIFFCRGRLTYLVRLGRKMRSGEGIKFRYHFEKGEFVIVGHINKTHQMHCSLLD